MKCKNCVRHVHVNDDGERTIGTPNWCFYLSDSPCEEIERDCPAFKSLTNADRIRSMTDEELADWLAKSDPECDPSEWWLRWLRQEVVSDG
jgi:hypothetical protein